MIFKPLKPGDLLGIIATSSAAKLDRFRAGCDVLEKAGFKLRIVGDPTAEYGTDRFLFASAPAVERAANLTKLFLDSEVKGIIAARGAGGVFDVLPLLDTQSISSNPKPFIGFSDSTALLVALRDLGCPTIHGPHVESFTLAQSDVEVQGSAEALKKLLTEGKSIQNVSLEPLLNKGDFEGELTGGNLSSLAALCGTPWQLKSQSKVVFIEETQEKPHRVHRMLTQLRLSGALQNATGICLGAFTKCEAEHGPNVETVIKDALGQLKVPVYRGVPSGHIRANTAIPFFGTAKVRADQLTVYLN